MDEVVRHAVEGGGFAPPPEAVIEVRGLKYAYRGREDLQVLRGIDLSIAPGEFVLVMGRTGAGKSTLCLALNGLIPKSFGGTFSGTVKVDGLNTADTEMADLARKIGIVQQNPESQLIGLTVAEDAEFGLENLALPAPEIQARARAALESVGLSQFRDASPWRLSGGQKQRLAIASALAFRPKVLVLDNPTAELDPVGRAEVLKTIARLNREQGITIVMVATDLYEVGPYADRVIVFDQGRIALDGTPEEIVQQPGQLRELGVKVPDIVVLADGLRSSGVWKGRMPADPGSLESELRATLAAVPAAPLSKLTRQTADPAIVFEGVAFAYKDGPEILKGVDLAIGAGEYVAVMGANGAGKTTIGKQMNGLLKPTRGKVVVAGRDTANLSVAELSVDVGYVFQNPDHQIVRRTLAEEFALGPLALGWPKERIDEAVARALEFLGFGNAETDPFFLGLAERNMVALATALIANPKVLVLDEPATGADHGMVMKLMRRVDELNRAGLTLVMVTHDASIVAEHARRLIVVREGRIAYDGTPAEIFSIGDALTASQVDAPPITKLSTRLADLGVPTLLKVEDAVTTLSGWSRNG